MPVLSCHSPQVCGKAGQAQVIVSEHLKNRAKPHSPQTARNGPPPHHLRKRSSIFRGGDR